MDIEDEQPLATKADILDIIPFLQICRKKRGKDFKKAVRRVLSKGLGIEIPKSEEDIEKEPFLMLGYGVNAYFNVLYFLSCMFICITIFSLPLYSIYRANSVNMLQNPLD